MNIKRNQFAINGKYCLDNPAAVVTASGEDAEEFLQGQFTQDLMKLTDQASAYGFLLTQKGRVLGDAQVQRLDAEQWRIFSWSLSAADLIARLDAFIIADDVELSDETAAWQAWRIGVVAAVADTPIMRNGSGFPLAAGGDPALAWSYWVSPAEEASAWPADWSEGSIDAFEGARITAGWPFVPVDLGTGDFPQEGGRHRAGISFTKGCYLGQEVMARLAATGRLRRGLAHVRGEGPVPTGEFKLGQDDRIIGNLRSRVALPDEDGWIGLAMLQLAHFADAKPLVDADGNPVVFDGMVGA
jgi:tRNA-modifying protein YgfZ